MAIKVLSLLVLVIILAVLLRIAVVQFSTDKIPESVSTNNGKLADCPNTPNCQASVATRESQLVAPFRFSSEPDQVIDVLANIIRELPRYTIVTQQADYLHATFKTALMGYTDDIEFRLNDQKTWLDVRSASRLGKSDFGANRKRITFLRELTNAKL